jgi:hypothetical protein
MVPADADAQQSAAVHTRRARDFAEEFRLHTIAAAVASCRYQQMSIKPANGRAGVDFAPSIGRKTDDGFVMGWCWYVW